jgi:hypothetical protein
MGTGTRRILLASVGSCDPVSEFGLSGAGLASPVLPYCNIQPSIMSYTRVLGLGSTLTRTAFSTRPGMAQLQSSPSMSADRLLSGP